MKKIIMVYVCFVVAVVACVLMSAGKVSNAVFTVDDGVYYHLQGDCAICEKSHDHNRKIRITSKETAEAKLYIPCRKCYK